MTDTRNAETRADWQLIVCLNHRYFLHRSGRIGVADESGELPPWTDNGTLYLDESRPITRDEDVWYIPLCHGEHKTRTPATWPEVVVVALTFRRMRVEFAGEVISIAETIDGLRPRMEWELE